MEGRFTIVLGLNLRGVQINCTFARPLAVRQMFDHPRLPSSDRFSGQAKTYAPGMRLPTVRAYVGASRFAFVGFYKRVRGRQNKLWECKELVGVLIGIYCVST